MSAVPSRADVSATWLLTLSSDVAFVWWIAPSTAPLWPRAWASTSPRSASFVFSKDAIDELGGASVGNGDGFPSASVHCGMM